MYGSGEGQIINGQVVKWSPGDSQVRVKSKKYSELDIGGPETCDNLILYFGIEFTDQIMNIKINIFNFE